MAHSALRYLPGLPSRRLEATVVWVETSPNHPSMLRAVASRISRRPWFTVLSP
ncbi:MAG TPA: hypothetical protein VL261_00185 [Nitrospira sp.]|jgi:hypothetical protein|nr:hypothetical protein [Nitrospira sp.]